MSQVLHLSKESLPGGHISSRGLGAVCEGRAMLAADSIPGGLKMNGFSQTSNIVQIALSRVSRPRG